MENGKTIANVMLKIGRDGNLLDVEKYIEKVKRYIDEVSISVESGETLIFIATSNPSALEEAASGFDFKYRVLAEPDIAPSEFGFPEEFDQLANGLNRMGVRINGFRTNEWRNRQFKKQKDTNEADTDCRSEVEIDSGQTEGTATDVTILDSISPETIDNAIDDAYANAAIEAGAAMAKLDGDECTCTEPCICMYVITYAPPELADNSSMEVTVNASGKSAGVEVSVGLTTTAHAYVRWTLWRMCLSPEEFVVQGEPPASGHAGIVTIGTVQREIPCPTRYEHGKTELDRLWTWSISWSLDNSETIVSEDLRKFISGCREELIQNAMTDGGEAIDRLDTCPSHCPKGKHSIVMGVPVISIRGGWKHHAGATGYHYAKRFIGSIAWSVYRTCCS